MLNLDVCRSGILFRISANLYLLQLQVLKLLCLYNFACCVFRLSFKENVFLSSTEFALSILGSLMIFCFLKMTAIACNGFEFNFVMNQMMLYIKWYCAQSYVAYLFFQYIEHCSISNVNVHRIFGFVTLSHSSLRNFIVLDDALIVLSMSVSKCQLRKQLTEHFSSFLRRIV